jgi:hypothetical protein
MSGRVGKEGMSGRLLRHEGRHIDQGEEGASEEPTGDGMSGRVRQEWISGKVRVSEKCQ